MKKETTFLLDIARAELLLGRVLKKDLDEMDIEVANHIDTRHLHSDLATIVKAVAGGNPNQLDELNDEVHGLLLDYLEEQEAPDDHDTS